MYERQPTKPSTSDCNLRDTARDLSDEHKTNYSNNRNHSRPRARDCSSDKRYRDPNKAGSSDQTVYRDYRSRDPSRGSSRDSLAQTCDDNRRRSCAGSKPILQRQGTFTELRKSRPQSWSFLNRHLPALAGLCQGLPSSRLNPRILMSQQVEHVERLLLFRGKYQRHPVESRRGSKLILQSRRGKIRLAQPTLGVFPDRHHPQHLPGSIGAVLDAAV